MPEREWDWNERYAAGQTPWDSGVPSLEMQRVLQQYKIGPQRTLEIGCGTGTNTVYLAQQGFDITGVDLSPLAIERSKARAAAAAVNIDFRVANMLDQRDVAPLVEVAGPYSFVFDRGVYHVLRLENLEAALAMLRQVTQRGSLYLLLAGNANDPAPPEPGPPRVAAHELTAELGPLFDLVQLREFRFDGVTIEGQTISPLAWSALWRRK